MSDFVMKNDRYIGKVVLPHSVFDKLNPEYFISNCTDEIKYMCANEQETKHLVSLGVRVASCDWYKIELGED